MKFKKSSLGMVAALALAGMSLAGCVVYPSGYGYGYGGGYGGGYYPAPAYYAPPVSFDFGFYGGHRWR
jgi:hypothetical protein